MIHHRRIQKSVTQWDDNGRWLGELRPDYVDVQPITHRHVHPDSTIAAFAELRKALDEATDAVRGLLPHWITYTEIVEFDEDDYDYILERVHDSMAQSAIWHGTGKPGGFPGISDAIEEMELRQKKKECMFENEDENAKS